MIELFQAAGTIAKTSPLKKVPIGCRSVLRAAFAFTFKTDGVNDLTVGLGPGFEQQSLFQRQIQEPLLLETLREQPGAFLAMLIQLGQSVLSAQQ